MAMSQLPALPGLWAKIRDRHGQNGEVVPSSLTAPDLCEASWVERPDSIHGLPMRP
jgi:hypothetical protein